MHGNPLESGWFTPMQSKQLRRLDKSATPDPGGVAAERLPQLRISRREAQVLGLVLAPYPNAEIASRLGVSKRTVESHVSALLRKLAVRDRPALIRAGGQLFARAAQGAGAGERLRPLTQRQLNRTRTDAAAAIHRVARRQKAAQLNRNIQRERDAIKLHETAAERLDELAARWLSRAAAATDEQARVHSLDRATTARQRAQSARARATEAKRRLGTAHVDPEP